MADPWAGKGPCGECGMPVAVGTVLCPVCGETNKEPVKQKEPPRYGRCMHCGMQVLVGTVLCDICGETNPGGVKEEEPTPVLTCSCCGMSITKPEVERTGVCPVCGEDPASCIEPEQQPTEARKAIDHLPGDVPEPPTQPLTAEAQALVDTALGGIATACVKVGANHTVTEVREDGNGELRVSISVAVGPDGKPLPPIPKRTGHPAATSILVIETTASKTHVRFLDVATNRIRYSKTAATMGEAIGPAMKDCMFLQPWVEKATGTRKGGRRVVAVVGAVVLALGVGGVILLAGGGDDGDVVAGPEASAGPTTAATEEPGLAAGTVSTDEADLEEAVLPAAGMPWVATKKEDLVPPPEPIQPLPVGHQFKGRFKVTESCTTDGCRYTTPMDLGAGIAVVPVPEVAWDQRGLVWYLESVADVQSSNTDGLVCSFHRQQSWDFTVTEATWDGERWVGSKWTGGMFLEQALDPNLSAAAIAKGYCPPYNEASTWTAVAG